MKFMNIRRLELAPLLLALFLFPPHAFSQVSGEQIRPPVLDAQKRFQDIQKQYFRSRANLNMAKEQEQRQKKKLERTRQERIQAEKEYADRSAAYERISNHLELVWEREM